MEFGISFITVSVVSLWLIRKEANYILGMELDGGITLSLIILAGIVILIGWFTSLSFIFEYFDSDPYYCEFCAKGVKI